MKRALVLFSIMVTVLLLGVTVAAADSDNAALVIKLDGGCGWVYDGLTAEGSVVFVETQNGRWKLSCTGEILPGLTPPDRAITVKSTAANPVGLCSALDQTTETWHATFTPSGKSSFTCQGK